MTAYRVWYSKVGADQNPPRPWSVKLPDGRCFLEADIVAVAARSAYLETGFELPDGPKGILECDDVVMLEPIPRNGGNQ
jgi:hypothetical protein